MVDQTPAPAGGFAKRHVSGMLKHLPNDDQREKALEAAARYKKLFAEAKWEPVFARMKRVAEEDDLRVVSRRRPAGHPLLTTSTSAPPAAMVDARSPPAEIPRLSTASSLVSLGHNRERWDVTSRGPSTPLSPTPVGNAFAPGGYWEQLTPKTPAPPQTPLSAVPPSPFFPIVPRDRDARAAYNQVKGEAEAMARTVCANRMSVHYTVKNSDDIPRVLLKRKDLLNGAEIALERRQANLQSMINPELPKLLNDMAEEEAKIIEKYSVKNILELLDLDMWLRVNDEPLSFTTLLDVQREMIQNRRNRQKGRLIELPEEAIHQAWATKFLEDAERTLEAEGDDSSEQSDEDKGYNYNNFLRSIKREASSSSNLVSMLEDSHVDLDSLRSSGTDINSLGLSRQTTLASQRLSNSPSKSCRLPLRSSGNTLANNPDPSPERRTRALTCDKGPSRIITNTEKEVPSPALSPEDRALRRQGASLTDLDTWAKQLKEMEQEQILNEHRVMAQTSQHPALRPPPHNRQLSGDSTLRGTYEITGRRDKKNKSMHNLNSNEQSPLYSRTSSSGFTNNFSRPLTSQTIRSSSDLPPPLPPAPPGYRYAPSIGSSLHGSIGRRQDSQSSGCALSSTVGDEDEWEKELKRMEEREAARQAEVERERRSWRRRTRGRGENEED
jgi:hypothetical protein